MDELDLLRRLESLHQPIEEPEIADEIWHHVAVELESRSRRPSGRMAVAGVAALVGAAALVAVILMPDRQATLATQPTIADSTAPPTTGQPTTTSTTLLPTFGVSGRLPTGWEYSVIFEPALATQRPQAIVAEILIDNEGSLSSLGTVSFRPGEEEEPTYTTGVFAIGSGGWIMSIEVDDSTLLGEDPAQFLTDRIHPIGVLAVVPAFELDPPLRWADDMEVIYDTFLVRPGCDEDAAVGCSLTQALQVLPRDGVASDDFTGDRRAFVETNAPRPPTDPSYLDPGPLSPRGGHQVVWVGSEMIVWGGSTSDSQPNLVDGAAFSPATSTWRTLPESPFGAGSRTRAVDAGEILLVVGADRVAAYEPGSDTWSDYGLGISPPLDDEHILWFGGTLAVWNQDGVWLLPDRGGEWTEIGRPPQGSHRSYEGALREMDGELVAIGNDEFCAGDRYFVATGVDDWQELPFASLATEEYADCSYPNQTASIPGGLVIWDSQDAPAMRYDVGAGVWRTLSPIPLHGTEGAQGPVPIGEGFFVPQWGDGVMFDGSEWHLVSPPGGGLDSDMVWTGTEILMWGNTCCYGAGNQPFTIDAWRWTVPVEVVEQ